MEYEIIWSIKAAGQMRRLDRSVAKRIHEKVGQLYQNPERFVEKLVRYPYYRLLWKVLTFSFILKLLMSESVGV